MTTGFGAGLTGLFLIGAFLSGCASHPETLVESPAFSVKVPEGWSAGGIQEPGKSTNFRRLRILKKGGLAVAEVNISWYDQILDLQSTHADRAGRIENKRFFKVKFDAAVNDTYGEYDALRARSVSEKWGHEIQVEMYCFHANGKTFVIWTGDMVEDLEKHVAGFRVIENSFSVR